MARIARLVVTDYPHHVIQRGVRSMDVFTADTDRLTYLRLMHKECSRFGVEVLAWCLMSNHVHLIVVPRRDGTLGRAIGNAHRRYTRDRNQKEGVKGYLFQGRFLSCVLDEQHLLAAARYTELNPVRAHMVQRAEDYDWSSARFHLNMVQSDPLVSDRTLMGLVTDWRCVLGSPDDDAENRVRKATYTGRPAGADRFVGLMERLTGRSLHKRKPGRRTRRYSRRK